MNILYVTQWFSSEGGGGEVVFYNLAKGMANRGHNVHIVCAQIDNIAENRSDNLNVYRIKPVLHLPPPSLKQNILYIIQAIIKGYEVTTQKSIEIIHANNLASVVAGSILSKITKKPLIITIHDIFSTSSPQHWKSWIEQDHKISYMTSIIAPLFEKMTVKMPTDIIHTVSNSSREDLVKFGAKAEIKVIPNGVDITIYDNAQPIKDYQNFVLFIGRLVFYKNLGTVISAFVDVLAKSPGSKMLIVGDGPMREKWLKMASDLGLSKNIDFIGHVSDERKIELLSKCSALLLPSFVEGFGLVILESFAMSKPVLVANVKPLSDIVDDGIDGFILPVDDPVKWSEKISYLINNREICKKMGNQGRIKLEKKFKIEHILDKIEPVYENLLKGRRKAIG